MSDGTLQTLDVTMLEDVGTGANQIVQLDSNAKIPACSAAAVTNLPSITKSSSDPTISTNPSGGVGTVYQNTTSGEMYVCTDATAGENVWTNVGAGSGDVSPFYGLGDTYGYAAGGGAGAPLYSNVIEKFAFNTSNNATDVGDLTVARGDGQSGHSSQTYGWMGGGGNPPANVIDRWSFSSNGNATDWGDLIGQSSSSVYGHTGHSSETHGYASGGAWGAAWNKIQKFTFASAANATSVGTLTGSWLYNTGVYSATYGYSMGGHPAHTAINKFSFASDGNATSVATLSVGRKYGGGATSGTHGYHIGGQTSGTVNDIEKFSMVSDGNGTDVGDLTSAIYSPAGINSATHGYAAGGSGNINLIQRFSFSSDGNSVDTTQDLTVGRAYPTGHQV
jgi:hypothetical protein